MIKEHLRNRFLLLLCTVAMTVLLTNSLLQFLEIRGQFFLVLFFSCLAAVLSEFATYSKITLAVTGAMILGYTVVYLLDIQALHGLTEFFSYVVDDIYLKLFLQQPRAYTSIPAVIFLVSLIMGFALHFLYTKAKSTVLTGIILVLYIFCMQFFFSVDGAEIYIHCIAAMLMILILAVHNRNETAYLRKSAGLWYKYMAPIIGSVLLITVAVAFLSGGAYVNQEFVNQVNEGFMLGVKPDVTSRERFLEDNWFQNKDGRIGGNVEQQNTFQFRVAVNSEAGKLHQNSLYLRGITYDAYADSTWKTNINDGNQYDLKDFFRKYSFFGSDVVPPERIQTLIKEYPEFFQKQIFTISKQKRFQDNVLFNHLLMTDLIPRNSEQIYYDYSGFTFASERPLEEYDCIYYSLLRSPAFAKMLRETWEPSQPEYPERIKNHYLQSQQVDPQIRRLAENITKDLDTPYDKAAAIEEYLKKNYAYTLTPGPVPEGTDVVNYFLFQNKYGYCTYYASAMTLMMRSLDIPARYVVGYRIDNISGATLLTVTGRNLHAWVEVYIAGFGWISFDPVGTAAGSGTGTQPPLPEPGNTAEPRPGSSSSPVPGESTPSPTPKPVLPGSAAPSVSSSAAPSRIPSVSPMVPPADTSEVPPEQSGGSIAGWHWILISVLGLLLLTGGGVLILHRRRAGEEKKSPVRLFYEFVRIQSFEGFLWTEGETVAAYFEKIHNPEYEYMSRILEHCFYQKEPLAEEAYTALLHLIHKAEKSGIQRQGRLKWLYHKWKFDRRHKHNRLFRK